MQIIFYLEIHLTVQGTIVEICQMESISTTMAKYCDFTGNTFVPCDGTIIARFTQRSPIVLISYLVDNINKNKVI